MAHIVGQGDRLAKAIIEREAHGRSRRSNWETLWQEAARYVIPREATFTETVTPGHERNRGILDSTAPRSLELFASFLHTLMNNPSQQWFKLRIMGQDRPSTAHAQWLERAEEVVLNAMVRAGIYEQLHQTFLYLGSVGTAVLYTEALRGQLRIRHFHLGDSVLEEGESGQLDMIYRQMFRTARQAKQRWGAQAGKAADEMLKDPRQDRKIKYIHAVFPMNEPVLGDMLPERLREMGGEFASVWVSEKDATTVSLGHYHEFPYITPRWYQTNDEVYGRSPAMSALPDIRMANRMKETILRGAEKLVDPPMMLPEGGLLSPLRLFPGSITFTDGQVQPQPLIPPGASRIEVGNALLEQTQAAIEKAFFVPLFVDIDEKVKTATQVLQEVDERNRAVSPMLMRAQSELYNRLIPRVFNVLHRQGQIPEPPDDLDGELTVEYVSPLTASQRQIEGLSLLRLFEGLAPWHGVDSGAFDHFDTDEVAKVLHSATGAPARVLRNETAVRRLRAQRLQQEQQAAQLQQLQIGAGAAADLISATAKAQ